MYRESNLKCVKTIDKELETLKLEKDGLDGKLTSLLKSSKNLDSHRPHGAPMIPPQRSANHRPHTASMRPSHRPAGHRPHGPSMNPIRPNMNGILEFADDTVTEYSRQSPAIETDPLTVTKSDKKETVRKPSVKYAEQYKKPTKRATPIIILMTKAIGIVVALGT
nr:hypothetical protein [Tanacetum cinerariifolium]